jgi:lambda family phage tail tape measure protein
VARTVEDIILRLGIEGFDGLDRIRSSFRDLGKVTQTSERDILSARDRLLEFARTAGNTEAVTTGLRTALTGLRGQVDMCGSAYRTLSEDLRRVNEVQYGATDATMRQREALVSSFSQTTRNITALRQHRDALTALQSTTRSSSLAFRRLESDIADVEERISSVTDITRRLNTALTAGIPRSAAGAAARLQDIRQGIELQRTLIAELDTRQAGETSRDFERRRRQSVEELTAAQERLNASLREYNIISFGENVRTGRESVRASAAAFNSAELTTGYYAIDRIAARMGDLPDTTAGLRQELSELSERLNNTTRGSAAYVDVAIRMAQVQRQLSTDVMGTTEAFRRLDLLEAGRDRRAAKVAAVQQYYAERGPVAPGIAGYRDPQTGALIARGTAAGTRQGSAVLAVETAAEHLANTNTSLLDATDALLRVKRNMIEAANLQQTAVSLAADTAASDLIAKTAAEFKQSLAAFDEQLQARDQVATRHRKMALALNLLGSEQILSTGLSGRELSPLYQNIVGLSTSALRRQQAFMGKSPTEVYNDIVASFETGSRTTLLDNRSQQVGEGIAQGIVKGATDSDTLKKGSKSLVDKYLDFIFGDWDIHSPSGVSRREVGEPIGQGIVKGTVDAIKAGRKQIQAAIQFALDSPAKAPLPGGLGGPVSDVADKLQNFLIRSSARPSATLPFARLLGEGVTSSAALPLATYRRAYERGGIVPPTFLPVEQRRGLRGTAGIPGAGLEEVIRAEAMRAVGRTGAFVGPLASALRREVLQPVTRLSGAMPGISRPLGGATPLPVFGAQAPALRQAPGIFAPYDLGRFQTDGPLTRGAQTFGRAAASSSLREALTKYRAATDNFWNGETGTYETLRRIISASAQVGASKLARHLSESRSRSAALSNAATNLVDRVTSPLVTLRTSIQTTAQQAGTKLRSFDIEAVKSVVPTAKQLVDQTLAPIKTLRTSLSTALQQSTTNLRELGSLGLSGLSFGLRGRGGTPPAGGGNVPPAPPTLPGGAGDSGADRGMDRLNTRLREFGPLSRRSISDLQDLRSVLDEVQASLSPLDSDYAALNRQIDKQTAAIDRQLERRDRTRRRPLSGMQMAQGVGAALSGGIFGGPEGLIGGLGGLAFGGVGGAFAGAAAGAQVGMFRQQLAGFADYAASLDKMKIALRGIVKDQASYNTVLAAANAATRELNVPQEAAIGGLTRLSAAILGAGGTVNQSTFAFRALTEAVTATGGKAEQVDGAMLALTQVFSKGKVSAEELNQIAERLPGTYTLFAEATGRTGPQLAKGLEQGKIGLNDLMKFLELLRTKHGQTALEIAASSENAGERLKVAYDKMREDVGRALQPLGAQFQSVFAKALKDATPALINLAQGLAKVIQVLGANAGAIALVAKFGVVLTSTIYAGRAFAALGPLVSGAAALMGAAFGRTTAQAIMAERQLKLFAATARATAAALAGPIIISVAIVGADLVIDYFNRIKRAKDRLIQVRSEATGEQFLRDIGGFALDRASVLRVANDVGRRYQVVQDLVVKLQREKEQLNKDFEASPSMATYFGAKLNELEPRLQAAIAESALLESRYKTLVRRAPNAPTAPSMPGFAEPPGTAAGAAGAGADAAKQQRDLFQQANEYVNANIELLKARGQLSEEQAATEFDRANLAKKFAIDELTLRKQALDLQKKYNQITPDIYTKSLQTLDVERQKIETAYNKTVAQIGEDISKINEEIFAGLGAPFDQRNVNEFERTLDDLQIRVQRAVVDVSKRGGPAATAFLKRAGELTTADYQRVASRSTVETLTKQITELQRGKGEVTTLDTIIADYGDSWQKLEEPIRKHLEQLATTVDHLKEIQRYKQDPNTYAGLREGALAYVESIGTIRSNVADLAQTGFKGVEDSITSLMTTGTANFREFATSLIADMTRVIVRQFIMRSLMQALGFLAPTPAGAATGLASSLSQFNAGAAQYGTGLGFAKGGAFDAANRIVPFAYGGVVNKPTMFKFADGGLMRNGVAGEAGPEAIMPLRRLPSGRLGVESSGGGAAPLTIQVNVDASGNQQMSGDAGQGQALGRVIAAVVQQELVNQKRPGGLLAS